MYLGKLKNIGRVKVTMALVESGPDEFIKVFMSKVIVLRAESYPNGIIDYIVYNKNLKAIEEGEKIPCYIGKIADGELSFIELP